MSPGADKAEKRSLALRIGIGAAVCAVYFVTGMLGLRFNAVSGFATLLWPPTGIALAALLFFGFGYWPAIAVGAFATNFANDAPAAVAFGIAVGNTLEAVIGAYLLNKAKFSPKIDRVSDARAFIGYAAFASTLVSATIGVASLFLGGVIERGGIVPTWTAWWIGDVLGNLVFGALLIVMVAHGRNVLRLKGSKEAFALSATVLAVSALVFAGPFADRPIMYLLLLPLLWAAVRFEQIGTVLATFAVMSIAVWATVFGYGPFVKDDLSQSLVFLQFFIGIVAAAKLVVASVQTERRIALEGLRGVNRDLADRVEQRSFLLSRTYEELKHSDESLAERHAILQAVLRGIGEGVIAVDMDGNTIMFNPAALNIMGLSMQEPPDRLERIFSIFPVYYLDGKTHVPTEDRPMARALRGESTVNQHLLIKSQAHPDGVRVSCTGTPIIDEKKQRIGGVVVFREIPK